MTFGKAILKSLLVTVTLILITFLPTFFDYQGLFLATKGGLFIFALFFVQAFFLSWQFPIQTPDRLSESVTLPLRTLLALFGGFFAAFVATHLSSFNGIAARLFTGLFASAIEIVCIFYISNYLSMIVVVLLSYRKTKPVISD